MTSKRGDNPFASSSGSGGGGGGAALETCNTSSTSSHCSSTGRPANSTSLLNKLPAVDKAGSTTTMTNNTSAETSHGKTGGASSNGCNSFGNGFLFSRRRLPSSALVDTASLSSSEEDSSSLNEDNENSSFGTTRSGGGGGGTTRAEMDGGTTSSSSNNNNNNNNSNTCGRPRGRPGRGYTRHHDTSPHTHYACNISNNSNTSSQLLGRRVAASDDGAREGDDDEDEEGEEEESSGSGEQELACEATSPEECLAMTEAEESDTLGPRSVAATEPLQEEKVMIVTVGTNSGTSTSGENSGEEAEATRSPPIAFDRLASPGQLKIPALMTQSLGGSMASAAQGTAAAPTSNQSKNNSAAVAVGDGAREEGGSAHRMTSPQPSYGPPYTTLGTTTNLVTNSTSEAMSTSSGRTGSLVSTITADRASSGSGASEGNESTPSSGSASLSPSNPLRSLNAAFTLSPRADSDSELMDSIAAPVLVLETDKDGPPEHFCCNFASLEERRLFVSQRCVSLAARMSTTRITESLLPALLTALECDDYSESFDDCAACIARVLPDIMSHLDELSVRTVSCFMGLIMDLCCSAEHAVVASMTDCLTRLLDLLPEAVATELLLPFIFSMWASFWSTPRAIAAGVLGVAAARPALVQASGMSVQRWFNCFVESSRDEAVAVREAAVRAMHQWLRVAQVYELSYVDMPLPLVSEFVTDDLSDAVRYVFLEETLRLAAAVGPAATTKYLQTTYLAACVDPSWRVRFVAARHLAQLAALVSHADDLVRVLGPLAEDEEREVRAALVEQLGPMSLFLSADVVERYCVQVVLRLAADADPVVRRSAAGSLTAFVLAERPSAATALHGHGEARGYSHVGGICDSVRRLLQDGVLNVQTEAIRSLQRLVVVLEPYTTRPGSKASTIAAPTTTTTASGLTSEGIASSTTSSHRTISPADGSGLNTAASSTAVGNARSSPHGGALRANASTTSSTSSRGSAAHSPTRAVMEERVAGILATICADLQQLGVADNWRVRDAVIYVLRYFCRVLSVERFAPLTTVLRAALRDSVSAVRDTAVDSLKVVAQYYGPQVAAQLLFELLQTEFALAQQNTFLWRVMTIRCLHVLLPVVSGLGALDLRRRHLLDLTQDMVQRLAGDRVPNVRLALARAMPQWQKWFSDSVRRRVFYGEVVKRLQEDEDKDVAGTAKGIGGDA